MIKKVLIFTIIAVDMIAVIAVDMIAVLKLSE
jgi:hypothetical protein